MASDTTSNSVTPASGSDINGVRLTEKQLEAAREILKAEQHQKVKQTSGIRKQAIKTIQTREYKSFTIAGTISTQTESWESLDTWECFSESSEGFNPLIKVSVTRAVYLNSGKSKRIHGGTVYRIHL